jgi:hypothetical protein
MSTERIIDARLVVGQRLGKNNDFWPQLRRWASSLSLVTAAGDCALAIPSTTRPLVQTLHFTHNLTAAMFVRRVATGLAKRAAFRPVAARPFSSSFARCKPQSPKRIPLIMNTQTHPLNHQSTSTATPSPANTPTKSSPSRVRLLQLPSTQLRPID